MLELMCAAAGDEEMRPGMVAVVQTAGDLANWHPHVHALVSRCGWTQGGEWIAAAFVDEHAAELLFRLAGPRDLRAGCLAPTLFAANKVACLTSPSIALRKPHDDRDTVEPKDQPAVERLARYIMRPPISLERMSWDGAGEVHYRRKRRKAATENGDAESVGAVPISRAARAEGRNARAMRRSWAQLIET